MLLLLYLSLVVGACSTPQVHLPNGVVLSGTSLPRSDAYLGIPFATSRRWRAPQLQSPVTGTYNKYGPMCLQPYDAFLQRTYSDMSEDCLSLNVFVPRGVHTSLSVLVWIHGGANTNGGSALYPADALASKNIIVVTPNYRLGGFGFLVTSEMQQDINFAYQDMLAAIKWVSTWITSFGGDPDSITIAGESAGASATLFLSASLSVQRFIRGSMAESPSGSRAMSRQEADAVGESVMKRFNCSSLKCMRDAPASVVVEKLGVNKDGYSSWPTVDSRLVVGSLHSIYNNSVVSSKPFLIGTNRFEGELLAYIGNRYSKDISKPYYFGMLKHFFGDKSSIVAEWMEDTAATKGYFTAISRILTQYVFSCIAESASHCFPQVYRYVFDATPTHWLYSMLNSTHTSELSFLFNPLTSYKAQLTPEQSSFSERFMEHVATFVNGTAAPWQPYTGEKSSIVYFNPEGTEQQVPNNLHHWDLCPQIRANLY